MVASWEELEQARAERDGFLAAYTAALVVAHLPLTAAKLNAVQLNPFRAVDPELERQIAEVRRFVAARGMAVRVEEAKANVKG